MNDEAMTQPSRTELLREPVTGAFGVVQKPLSTFERIANIGAVRKSVLLVVLAAIWEIYARILNNPLLFPTFTATLEAFFDGFVHGTLLVKSATSLRVLLMGYAAGIFGAAVLTIVAIS